MEFKQALKLLRHAEKKARKLQGQIDACHIQFDNMKAVMDDKFTIEWQAYCDKADLAYDYTFGDTLC